MSPFFVLKNISFEIMTTIAPISRETPPANGEFAIMGNSRHSKKRTFTYNFLSLVATLQNSLSTYVLSDERSGKKQQIDLP